MGVLSVLHFTALCTLRLVAGHGQLTVPFVRGDSQGRRESYEQRAPVYTIDGNRGGYSATSMRCHDFQSEEPQTTLQAGASFDATWTMEAGHPGDCYFYVSYDDPSNAVNFFKIAAIPGCGSPNGLNIPASVTTSVVLPAELPSCEHCVLRWEWTAHQQVNDIEFYVQCADVKITSSAAPVLPAPITAIAGIEHLPSSADAYRKVYSGQGPEDQYLVGPAIATYSSCDATTPGCLGLGLAPIDSSGQTTTDAGATTAAPQPGTTLAASTAGCSCTASTEWDGSFGQYAAKDFCSQNFGAANPWISAGGGDGSSGGFSGPAPCQTNQYDFKDGGWFISADQQALGKMPYRAFAYAQFCNGKAYSECWTTGEATFSFSFMVNGISDTGAYVKVLFWTDNGNILGLIPPNHPKGEGKLRLVAFMTDDYPNAWSFEKDIAESTWYHVQVTFKASAGTADVVIDGEELGSGTLPVNMLSATNGPQIGIYSFDYASSTWPADGLTLALADACIGSVTGTCTGASATDSVTSAVAVTTPEAQQETDQTIQLVQDQISASTAPPADSPADSLAPSAGSCPLPGSGLPSFVSECYCGFIGADGAGCGPDDGTACWCRCCCHHMGGGCRYQERDEDLSTAPRAAFASKVAMLSAAYFVS